MSAAEREELIYTLHLRTGWNLSAFEKMTDQELRKLYDERVAR